MTTGITVDTNGVDEAGSVVWTVMTMVWKDRIAITSWLSRAEAIEAAEAMKVRQDQCAISRGLREGERVWIVATQLCGKGAST